MAVRQSFFFFWTNILNYFISHPQEFQFLEQFYFSPLIDLKARQQEIPKVESIIAEQATEFMNWYRSLDVVPTITNLRQQFDTIRQQELKRTLNRLPDLDEREQKIITELSHRLMNKFLHQPTVRLREEAAHGNGVMYVTTLRELFALEVDQ